MRWGFVLASICLLSSDVLAQAGGYDFGYSQRGQSAASDQLANALQTGGMANELMVWLALIVGFVLFVRRQKRIGSIGPTLVLKKFEYQQGNSDAPFVDIVGRPAGIIAWLLSLLKLDADTNMLVTARELRLTTASLAGQFRQTIPLTSISSTHCSFTKPIWLLFVAVLVLVAGIYFEHTIYGVILAIIALIAYYLMKELTIAIETKGGMVLGLTFRRSIIGNVAVEMPQALEVIEIINKLSTHAGSAANSEQ